MFELMNKTCDRIKSDIRCRYIVAAVFNTMLGYLLSVFTYFIFRDYFSTLVVILLANFFTISTSFLVYKLFVFNTKGNWIKEYFKCYVVYGANTIFGIGILWALVDLYDIKYWISQAIAIIIMGIFTFLTHSNFTFRP